MYPEAVEIIKSNDEGNFFLKITKLLAVFAKNLTVLA